MKIWQVPTNKDGDITTHGLRVLAENEEIADEVIDLCDREGIFEELVEIRMRSEKLMKKGYVMYPTTKN